MKKLIMAMLFVGILAGCSAMKSQADGRYFNFGSKNNSEATIWLEKIVVDGKWNAPATGTLGCSSGNINGARSTGSVSNQTLAPQKYIYLEWYSWESWKRMRAKIELPKREVVNQLLLNPPWDEQARGIKSKNLIIIDFRPNHKVWIKLAKNSDPRSDNEVMVLAEGYGVETNDEVTRYKHFKEGKSYNLDCAAYRKETIRLGGYDGPFETYDKWYTEFIDEKGTNNE